MPSSSVKKGPVPAESNDPAMHVNAFRAFKEKVCRLNCVGQQKSLDKRLKSAVMLSTVVTARGNRLARRCHRYRQRLLRGEFIVTGRVTCSSRYEPLRLLSEPPAACDASHRRSFVSWLA